MKSIVVLLIYLQPIFSITCDVKQTCRQCIEESNCAWCIPENTSGSDIHCYPQEKISTVCTKSNIVNPRSKIHNVDSKNDNAGRQLLPSNLNISLRRGESVNVTFTFKRSKNYPLDLYFLLDSSKTLATIRDSIAELGIKLEGAIEQLTDNFRLGFGTFVDKKTMPFTNTEPSRLKEPCEGCVPTYGFKNRLSFNMKSTAEFSITVNNTKYSGNVDAIEGGLDALVQVMACKKLINWRDGAVHLIVLTTDNGFHIAGDGKLAGIIKPNDGMCHMDRETGEYLSSLDMDYPSIAQINEIAIRENMSIIFALFLHNKTNKEEGEFHSSTYDDLANRIEGARLGILNGTSEVTSLIQELYNEIVKSVRFTDDKDDYLDVKYFSKCTGDVEKETRTCEKIEFDKVIEFTAAISLTKCPENETSHTQIQIRPQGIQDTLTINVKILCECSCEKPENSNFVPNARECSNAGNLTCGICNCNNDRIGRNCECDAKTRYKNDDNKCSNGGEICSSKGECICGQCECFEDTNGENFKGKFCECSDYNCPLTKGKLCSGNGVCECGKCHCNENYHGEACECSTEITPCENNSTVCSNRGKCECGKCECAQVDGHNYSGKYCEECITCFEYTCPKIQNCLECSNPVDCSDCKYVINIVDTLSYYDDESFCSIILDECYAEFYYVFDIKRDQITLNITDYNKSLKCPQKIDAASISSGIFIVTILFGILGLAIYKYCLWRQDRIEYKKFVQREEQALQGMNELNPLYNSPITEIQNPLFNT